MARKPHPSSVLKTLPDEDQEALFDFLRDKTLEEGVKWLFSNNGVRTNKSSLSDWHGWYSMNQEIGAWQDDVAELQKKLEALGTDAELIPKIGEAVFISRAAKTGDAKMYATVASVIQRHRELKSQQEQHGDRMQLEDKKLARKDRALQQAERKLEQADRRIALLEAKLKDADDLMKDTQLSAEERETRWKEIFGR